MFVALFLMFVTRHRNVHSETHFLPTAYRLYPDMENKIHKNFLQVSADYAEICA